MIFRLACLQIQSHRLRTIFVAVAAVLTSILYMTVISISYCILDSTQLSRRSNSQCPKQTRENPTRPPLSFISFTTASADRKSVV